MEKLTNIRSLLEALSRAMNLINPEVENHHQQAAYFAYFIGREMGLDTEELHLAIYAALLHDVGSVVMTPWKARPAKEFDAKTRASTSRDHRRIRPEHNLWMSGKGKSLFSSAPMDQAGLVL